MTNHELKQMLEQMFETAAANLSGTQIQRGKKEIGRGKLFEFRVLLEILQQLANAGYSVRARGVHANVLRFPLNPSTADKSKYSYFEAVDPAGNLAYEIWVSVEVGTLSKEHFEREFPSRRPFGGKAGFHEVDVAVFDKLARNDLTPSYSSLCMGVSCKSNAIKKEQLREALGLRRETALLSTPEPSKAPWFVGTVPANPASPFLLYSADLECLGYKDPVESLGLYVRYLQFP